MAQVALDEAIQTAREANRSVMMLNKAFQIANAKSVVFRTAAHEDYRTARNAYDDPRWAAELAEAQAATDKAAETAEAQAAADNEAKAAETQAPATSNIVAASVAMSTQGLSL